VDFTGKPGNFRRKLRVYGRTGEPCARCGQTIEKIKIAGRSSHHCPDCQAEGG
jgi:formamidopyrimidine-DNA glycosylase